MPSIDRRSFLKGSLVAAASLSVARPEPAAQTKAANAATPDPDASAPGIIDTNVNLLGWPFRRLRYDDPAALVAKLRRHRVKQAWAGSFEALFHKDIDGVNTRLVEACQRHGDGMLLPFGTVNPVWPGWERHLDRCVATHRMRGIRVYPGYQPFNFDAPEFERLVAATAERGLLLQICFQMEDPRVHHPALRIQKPVAGVLPGVLAARPAARVQCLHWNGHLSTANLLQALMERTRATIDISNLETDGGVGRLLDGNHWHIPGRVPLERMLFGSMMPYFPFECAGMKLFESPLSRPQLEAIMWSNAARLLG